MIALQGLQAAAILTGLTPHDLSKLRPFRAVETTVIGAQALVARTGYTGEDGFEIVLAPGDAVRLWEMLLGKGTTPCGLGARDVRRLEAGLALHGNDIDLSTNPYEAGLSRFVDPDRADYVAGEALRRIRDEGNERSLVGFNMVGWGIARQGHPIMDGSERIGTVTSGGVSPTLDMNIGMGYVPTGFSDPPTRFQIDVRGRLVDAEVTALPFYSRRRSA
jgi:aminomethyltransferase